MAIDPGAIVGQVTDEPGHVPLAQPKMEPQINDDDQTLVKWCSLEANIVWPKSVSEK
jgi:hypothetical protein